MKTGATLIGVAAILAVLGYFGVQAFDRYEQHEARRVELKQQAEELALLRSQNAGQGAQMELLRLQNDLLRKQAEVLQEMLKGNQSSQ